MLRQGTRLKCSKQSWWPLERIARARFCKTLESSTCSFSRILDLVISGGLKCPPSGNGREAVGRFTKYVLTKTVAMVRWGSCFAGLFTKRDDPHPYGNGLYWKTSANLYRLNHWSASVDSMNRKFRKSADKFAQRDFQSGSPFRKLLSSRRHPRWMCH